MVALPNTGSINAQAVAERLKENVAVLTLEGEMSDLRLSVTIGIAVANAEDDLDALITRADNMLYRGQRDGRNQVVMLS